jgi:hypothetical protein
MTDRTAERPAASGFPRKPDKSEADAGRSDRAEGRSDEQAPRDRDGGSEETRKVPLVERMQAALRSAADEHRANAESTPGRATRARAATTPASSSGRRPPRRARLRLTRIDPWSVMKAAFLLSIALGIVLIVAVAMVWSVLGAAGVWESINATVSSVLGGETASSFDVENYVGTSRVMGFTMLIAALDVVLLTAIATLGAFLYNMAAALLGGVEVTLAEDLD